MRLRVLAAICLALGGASFAEELPFTQFTPDGGPVRLPSASVQKIVQDHVGHIWFAFFSSGIARYDGHSLEQYGIADGLRNLTVRELAEDPSGHLWVGTDSGLVVSGTSIDDPRPQRLRFLDRLGGVALPRIPVGRNALAIDADGWATVASAGGLLQYRFAGSRIESRVLLPHAGVSNALTIGRDGSLRAILRDGRFVRVPRGTTRIETFFDPAFTAEGQALFETMGGDLIAGAVDGSLWRLRQGTARLERIEIHASERVTAIAQTADGRVWVATLGSGLRSILLNGDPVVRSYTRRDGLLGETLWTILIDRERNLWLGQNGGASRLRGDFDAFASLTGESHTGEVPALPDRSCFAVAPPQHAGPVSALDPLQWTWVATGGGLAVIGPDGATATVRTTDGLASNSVYSVVADADAIYVATGNGVNVIAFGEPPRIEPMTVRRIRLFGRDAVLAGFALPPVAYRFKPVHAPNGDVIPCAAMNGGRFSCAVDGRWVIFRTPGFGSTFDFDVDVDGYLFLATTGRGVLRSREPFTLDGIRRLGSSETFFERVPAGGDTARCLLRVDGVMWAGLGDGVAVYRGAVLQSKVTALSAPVAMTASPSGRLWIAHSGGLTELDRQGRPLRRLTARDGLLGNEAWEAGAIAFGADGRLYFATPRGLSIVRAEGIGRNALPPPVRVEHFSIQQNRSGTNEVAIEYSALSFVNEENVRYRTRLAGYDAGWSPPVTATSLRYTNLPAWVMPKEYVFEVMASNNDGVWSAPHRFAFRIRPAWWRTWWAFGAGLAVLALAVRLLLRHRTRKLAARNRELAMLVAAGTAELQEKASELAMLDAVVEAINRETTLDSLLQTLLEQGAKLMPQVEKGVVLVADRGRDELRMVAQIGYADEMIEGLVLPMGDAVGRYFDHAEAIGDDIFVVRESAFDHLAARETMSERAFPIPKAMLTMRVGLGESVDGILAFDNFRDTEAFSRTDVRTLERFRRHALSAIDKARMLRVVQAATEAKSSFLAKMSHEIRTPLNAILGFVQLMLRRAGRSDADRESLRIILRSGEHLLGLINDVLSMAKIEAGQATLNETSFDCAQLLRAIADTVSARASAKGLRVELRVEGFPPAVRGDSGKLRQVLLNLLDNAIKFTARGAVTLEAAWDGGRAAFAVADSGAGMTAEERERLFRPFAQATAGAASAEGTGLGLAICNTFVQMMGGAIAVDSEPGRGSRFAFDIALAADAAAAAPDARRKVVALAPGQPERRLLVADDTAENRLLLERLFSSLGFSVRSAANGQEAVDAWSEWKPDAVWMDIRMPLLDGYAATRAIRAAERESGRHTVVIALTASAFEHDRERIFAAGCDDFVAKPFLEETLFAKLTEHLGVSWIFDERPESPAAAPPPPAAGNVPPAIRARMIDALDRGDVDAAMAANDDLRVADAALASRVAEMLKGYRFDDVQALVEAGE